MRAGEFVSGDAALVARAMLGALNWSVQWFRPDGPLTAEEIAEQLADYLLRGLLAKPDSLRRFAPEGEMKRIRAKQISARYADEISGTVGQGKVKVNGDAPS